MKKHEVKMNKKLDDALTRLADLFEYGSIQAAATPVDFIDRVAAEVIESRKRIADTMNEVDEMQPRITELEVEAKLYEYRKRADSMKLALDSAQNIVSVLSRDIEAARVATETLDSERAANAALTKRVEELEAELLRRNCDTCAGKNVGDYAKRIVELEAIVEDLRLYIKTSDAMEPFA